MNSHFKVFLFPCFLIVLAAMGPAFSSQAADRCSDQIGNCSYYSCIEQERLSCGSSGYALGYGQAYCEKFSELTFQPSHPGGELAVFPAAGNEWRDEVRACLQYELEDYFAGEEEKDCRSLRAFAFESHPRCYTSGPSFCALKPQSIIKIGLTINTDLLTAESLAQVRDTATICVRQLDERIADEPSFFVRWKLKEYQGIWRLVAANPIQLGNLLKPYAAKAQ